MGPRDWMDGRSPTIDGLEAGAMALWVAGAVIQLAIAILVYQTAPRDPRHVSLAAFAGLNGVWDGVEGLALVSQDLQVSAALQSTAMYVAMPTVVALAFFLAHYPSTARWARHRAATALGVSVALVSIFAYAVYRARYVHAAGVIPSECQGVCEDVGPPGFQLLLVLGRLWFPLLVLGSLYYTHVRGTRVRPDPATFLVAAALLIYPTFGFVFTLKDPAGILSGSAFDSAAAAMRSLWQIAALSSPLVAILLVVTVWRSTHGGRGLALRIAALLVITLAAGFHPFTGGLASLAFTTLLAYAVLRHRLLGIDVKLRFAISKSTIAALFVAVFFVASEAAQQFFGDRFESGYLGILAAGALVFAIAPMSRLADRIAEKAVPVADAPRNDPHEEAYKAAVRLALRGGITRREELELARIAEAYGIGALRAHHLRDEVEQAPEESTRPAAEQVGPADAASPRR